MTIHRTWHTLININNMKFSAHCLGLFNFLHIRFCELQKASRITPWKNATRYCAGPAYYRMCSTDVYCLKQTGSSSTKETITHHFFVSGIGQKKTVDAAKICSGAENVVKTETANIRKWIARLLTQAFILRWKRVCAAHNNCMSCP